MTRWYWCYRGEKFIGSAPLNDTAAARLRSRGMRLVEIQNPGAHGLRKLT